MFPPSPSPRSLYLSPSKAEAPLTLLCSFVSTSRFLCRPLVAILASASPDSRFSDQLQVPLSKCSNPLRPGQPRGSRERIRSDNWEGRRKGELVRYNGGQLGWLPGCNKSAPHPTSDALASVAQLVECGPAK